VAFLTANLRISLSLACIALSLFFVAMACRLVPDYYASKLETRKSYCEHLALHCSLAVGRDDVEAAKEIIQSSLRRHPDVLSAGLRASTADTDAGNLLLEVGDHRRHWDGKQAQQESTDSILVPIIQADRRWGTLELQFQPLQPPGVMGFLQHPLVGFSLFFSFACATIFYFFLRMMFRQMDFAQARIVPKRVRTTLNTLTEGVVILDKEGQIVMANDAFAQAVGQSAEELQGRKVSELDWNTDDRAEIGELPWERAMKANEATTGAIMRLNRDEMGHILSVNATPIVGDDGTLRGTLASFDNLTPIEKKNNHLQSLLRKLRKSRAEIQRQNVHLQDLAMKDPLTGCLNRRAFFAEFEQHWNAASLEDRPLCCIMLDIDHFKAVNDNHGHSTGDQVLQQVSQLLRKKIRTGDHICRYGGEEFCVLLPALDIAAASHTAERLRREIESSQPARLPVTASLGVSAIGFGAKNMQELLDQADKSLYAAKRGGRNRVVRWDQVPADTDFREDKQRAKPKAPALQAAMPFQTVNVLLTTLASRHPATAEHCRRVGDLCVIAANGLLSSSECYVLELAALLHDIGKLGVPDAILLKVSPLTSDEWTVIRSHVNIGEELVAAAFSSKELSAIIRGSHFRFEGDPKRKDSPKGEEIPIAARILAIADAYDSMISDQVYRKRRSKQEAFQELRAHVGTQFDPDLVDLFIQRVMDQDPAPVASRDVARACLI